MKKLLIAGLVLSSSLFATTSLEQRVSVLEKKVAQLEKQLNIVDHVQSKIKKNISENSILKCNKLKLVNYSFNYENSGFIQSYDFKYILKNDYNKSIKYVYASIKFLDQDETNMVDDYIKQKIVIKPNTKQVIKTNYLINSGALSESLKDTPKKDIKVIFNPFKIVFSDGTTLKCNN